MHKLTLKLSLFAGLIIHFLTLSSQQKTIALADIWASPTFAPKGVQQFNGLNDGKHFVRLEKNAINVYEYKSGKLKNTLVDGEKLAVKDNATFRINQFWFNHDETQLLLTTDSRQLYRHSSEALVYVYDIATEKLTSIFEGMHARYPTFSPTGKMVAAVIDNNIFTYDLNSGAITTIGGDGKAGEIINGAVDWVYEEEFSMSQGYEWSPGGDKIAYYKFDESHVKEFSIDYYKGQNYPSIESYKYPKAGEKNANVGVYLFDFSNNNSILIEQTKEDDSYLPRIQWATNDLLYIQKLNRHQNHWQVFQKNTKTGHMIVVWEEKNAAYIDINDKLWFTKNGDAFLFLSEQNGWNQLFLLTLSEMKLAALTEASYDVDHIIDFDLESQTIYYSAADEHPSERNVYKYDLKKKSRKKLNEQKGWNSFKPTKGGQFFLHTYSTFNSPTIYTLRDNNGNKVRVLEDNKELVKTLETYQLGQTKFGSLTTESNVNLTYWQILPPNFDSSKQYPVLFFVYGGPGSQTVKNAWGGPNYLWHQLLAQKGYIVMSVDNRGTGFRGEAFKKVTYLELGKYEIQDQMEAALYMASKRYVDKERIGIWGWSYGGFMSSLGISAGADVFKTAIAVAPVTHWKYYDNIYTERYMRTPKENPNGYEKNAPIYHANKIKGNYLLIHGMADDNVHLQHANEMINEMVKHMVEFDSEYYPNKNHGIYGGSTRLHLYRRMTQFISEKL